MLTAGLGGAARHGCVALSAAGTVVSVCGQERVTRTKAAAFNATGLPDEALDISLGQLGRRRVDVTRYVMAEPGVAQVGSLPVERIDHHFAHACTSYLTSPFQSAAIVVCDHEPPGVSVWLGRGAGVSAVEWPWRGPGFADLYSSCAAVMGEINNGDQRMEALARLRPDARDDRLETLMRGDGSTLDLDRGWDDTVRGWRGAAVDEPTARAALAASLQARVIDLFLAFLRDVHARTGAERLCLAGSLFYHSSIITAARLRGPFAEVFAPIDPGNAGLSVGAALQGSGIGPQSVSPFLGPSYTPDAIKEILDNCKLQYSWESQGTVVERAVQSLQRGGLVGWFDGPMEWGPRALGGRSILANPFSPFVLENLNRFLKRRESWRGYALSGLHDAVRTHFSGPTAAQFMECDYVPRDPERFRHVLPMPGAALRVQTIGDRTPPRFAGLLEAFGSSSGLPILVNTSFNGFHEPIVCSPRDAVRVFFGSGLDLLVLGQFVLSK